MAASCATLEFKDIVVRTICLSGIRNVREAVLVSTSTPEDLAVALQKSVDAGSSLTLLDRGSRHRERESQQDSADEELRGHL